MPNPSIPVDITWGSSPVKAYVLRETVADAIAFLSAPPVFSGSQQVTAQSIPTSTITAVTLDTDQWDNYAGHSLTTNTARYYGQVPGWYLCETSVPLNYTGGVGVYDAYVGGVQNGAAAQEYSGVNGPPLAGGTPSGVAAKLMQVVQVGTDYMGPYFWQSSGAAQTLVITASKFPQFSAQWICANSGTAGLPVPPLTSFPVPPSYLTSAFFNANIRDTIRFLVYPPVCEYEYIAGTNTLASQASLPATGTTIALDTKIVDTYSAYSTGTNTWTAPVNGVYYAYFCLQFTATAASSVAMAAGLTITSSNYNSGTAFTWWGGTMTTKVSSSSAAVVRKRLRLNAGDTVSPAGFQNNSASNAATIGGALPNCSTFIMAWRSM